PILRNIVELDPRDINVKLKLARLVLVGSPDEALNLVNAAVELDGRNPDVLAMKALVLFKLNDLSGAIREALAALDIDHGNAGALIVLAAERVSRGDTKGALAMLDTDPVAHERDLGIQLFKLKI